MRVWKFIVPSDRYYTLPSDPAHAYKGIVGVAIAETEEEARKVMASDGDDVRWLEIARVKSFDLDRAVLVALAMV